MHKILLVLLICFFPALAENTKLYLKDGTFHIVREYKVQGDRVSFYSIERSEWEEIPGELVDLQRTDAENSAHKTALADEARIITDEDKAAKALRDEIMKIPQDPGVYSLEEDGKLRIFHLAESKIHNEKGRNALKKLSPVPFFADKATLELDLDKSLNVLTQSRPNLYVQLSDEVRFGLAKLTPRRGVRIVEKLSTVPATKEIFEEFDLIETFRKQLTDNGLYKIWPTKPLEPGEYAVIEYEPGKVTTQVWDFEYKK